MHLEDGWIDAFFKVGRDPHSSWVNSLTRVGFALMTLTVHYLRDDGLLMIDPAMKVTSWMVLRCVDPALSADVCLGHTANRDGSVIHAYIAIPRDCAGFDCIEGALQGLGRRYALLVHDRMALGACTRD
jgi:hypothetical protein